MGFKSIDLFEDKNADLGVIENGAGVPSHASTKGKLYIDTTNAKLYICTVATGTWVVVGTQTA